MSELNVANDSIDRWSRDKDIILELTNPEVFIKSKFQVDKIIIRLELSNVEEQEPGERTTSVSTSGLDWGSTTWRLPGDAVNGLWKTTISPHCSNTTCKLSFQTSSTNGGTDTVKY